MFDRALRWWYSAPVDKVTRVLAFYSDGSCDYVSWDPKKFEGSGWEGLDCDRLEIRVVRKGKKRRVVLYPGDLCDPEFPPPQKHIVINARLLPRSHVGATAVDVTTRVQKYMGNTLKSVHHMFPWDDHDDNAARFEMVRIIDLSMRVTDLPIEEPHTQE